jgi:hypothetical protein
MPNWCQNVVTISHENSTKLNIIHTAVANENNLEESFFNVLVPRPIEESENWYDWNVQNWGTKWDVKVEISEHTENSITLVFDSAWAPPIEFYNKLVEQGYEVLGYYNEEGMAFAGIYDNGDDETFEYGDMSADDIEDELPEELNEMFNIAGNKADWESEQENEEE